MGFSRMFGELGKSRQVFCSIDVALDVVDFDVVNVDIDVVHVDIDVAVVDAAVDVVDVDVEAVDVDVLFCRCPLCLLLCSWFAL